MPAAAFLVAYLALIALIRPARATRLVLALSAFVAVRFLLVLAFNPGEAILYVSVATLALLYVLFHFLETSRLRYKTAFAAALLVAIAGANVAFFF